MKPRVHLGFELETCWGSEPEGKARAAALVKYSPRKPNHTEQAICLGVTECLLQEIQLRFFALISDLQNKLLDHALPLPLQGCVPFCRAVQVPLVGCQSTQLQAFDGLKMKERLLHSWVLSTGSGFKAVSGVVESLITVASPCSLLFMSCVWSQDSRSQCPPRAVGTHCLPVRLHTQQLRPPLLPQILWAMA